MLVREARGRVSILRAIIHMLVHTHSLLLADGLAPSALTTLFLAPLLVVSSVWVCWLHFSICLLSGTNLNWIFCIWCRGWRRDGWVGHQLPHQCRQICPRITELPNRSVYPASHTDSIYKYIRRSEQLLHHAHTYVDQGLLLLLPQENRHHLHPWMELKLNRMDDGDGWLSYRKRTRIWISHKRAPWREQQGRMSSWRWE